MLIIVSTNTCMWMENANKTCIINYVKNSIKGFYSNFLTNRAEWTFHLVPADLSRCYRTSALCQLQSRVVCAWSHMQRDVCFSRTRACSIWEKWWYSPVYRPDQAARPSPYPTNTSLSIDKLQQLISATLYSSI